MVKWIRPCAKCIGIQVQILPLQGWPLQYTLVLMQKNHFCIAKRKQLTLNQVDSGLFVARWFPRNKHVDQSVNVPISEQQLDYVPVSEMKEFTKQLQYCLCILQPDIVRFRRYLWFWTASQKLPCHCLCWLIYISIWLPLRSYNIQRLCVH